MLACILFVFGTLTEYAGILFAVGLDGTVDEYFQEPQMRETVGIRRRKESLELQQIGQSVSHKW